jgi:hypothetical protein
MADLTGGQLVARTLQGAGVRHEQAAAHAGDAYARLTRGVGPALTQALASDEVWCLNVVLDPEAYRKSGQGSMAV